MSHVWAYHKRTGQKRRIPAGWMQPNTFGGNWSLTPSSRDARKKKRAAAPVRFTEPASSEAGSPTDPAPPDTREDQ